MPTQKVKENNLKSSSNLYSPQWVSTDQLPKDLYSEILPNLFMGGTHDDDVVYAAPTDKHKINSNKFDCVITTWAQPCDWDVQEMRYGIPDSEIKDVELSKLLEIAQWGHKKWLSGERVLIRCQAGLNRSGLITALILLLEGMSPEQAIAQIRQKRSPVALFNKAYVDWILTESQSKIGHLINNALFDKVSK